MSNKAKMGIIAGVVVLLVAISFAFGSFLGNKYDNKTPAKENKDYVKKMEETKNSKTESAPAQAENDEEKTSSADAGETRVEDNGSSDSSTEAVEMPVVVEPEVSKPAGETLQESSSDLKSPTQVYRVIVDGKQQIALTGYQKALEHAKKSYTGHVVIERKDGAIVEEFDL